MRGSAARAIGRQVVIASVASARDFDAAFAQFMKAGAGALLVPGGSLTTGLRRQIVALAIRPQFLRSIPSASSSTLAV